MVNHVHTYICICTHVHPLAGGQQPPQGQQQPPGAQSAQQGGAGAGGGSALVGGLLSNPALIQQLGAFFLVCVVLIMAWFGRACDQIGWAWRLLSDNKHSCNMTHYPSTPPPYTHSLNPLRRRATATSAHPAAAAATPPTAPARRRIAGAAAPAADTRVAPASATASPTAARAAVVVGRV